MKLSLTEEHYQIIHHSYGFDQASVSYRNYYAAHPDDERLIEMEKLGLMVVTGRDKHLTTYRVTEAGWQAYCGAARPNAA